MDTMALNLSKARRYELLGMLKARKTVTKVNKATGMSRVSLYMLLMCMIYNSINLKI